MSQQINLLNPALYKKRQPFSLSAVKMAQGFGLVLVGTAVFAGYARFEVGRLAQQAHTSDEMLKSEQGRLAKMSTELGPAHKSVQLEQEATQLEADLKEGQEIMDTLKSGVIGNTEGFSPYLRAFARQSVPGLWLTGFSISGGGGEMVIQGRALNPELVPAYIRRLNQENAFQGKKFAALQISLPKEVPGAKPAGPRAPRYIEFNLATSEEGERAVKDNPATLPAGGAGGKTKAETVQ